MPKIQKILKRKPHPKRIKRKKKKTNKEESEYEDVTDPEFDAFNSDDSSEHKRIIPIDYNWGGKGKILKKNIKVKIKVFVKTFFGSRTKQEFVVNINDKIESLVGKLENSDEIASYHIIKFIYPMGRVRQLSLTDTFANQNIPENACLVMIGRKDFHWDVTKKGRNITVSVVFLIF